MKLEILPPANLRTDNMLALRFKGKKGGWPVFEKHTVSRRHCAFGLLYLSFEKHLLHVNIAFTNEKKGVFQVVCCYRWPSQENMYLKQSLE